jgi:hypothetical protein
VKIAGIALLKLAIRQARFTGTLFASFNEIAGNIDAQYFRSKRGFRERGRPVTTSQVQNFQTFGDSEPIDY